MRVWLQRIVAMLLAVAVVCEGGEASSLRAKWEMPPRCTPFAPPRVKDLKEELRQTGYRLVIAVHPERKEKGEYPPRDLYLIHADGSGPKQLTNTPRKEEHKPRTAPNGRLFSYNYGDYVVDAKTLKTRQVYGAYAWTPDSKRAVHVGKRGIVHTDMTTGEKSKPIPVEQRVSVADLSSDGKWLVFEIRNFRGSKYSIDFMSVEGGPIRKMPNHPIRSGECHPGFSPDGKWICWNGGRSLSIRRFDPSLPEGTDGKVVTLPKELLGQDPCGRWSHCGRYIAYVKIPHGGSWKVHSPLCIVRLADHAATTLSPPGWVGHHWDYDWLPPEDE